MRDNFLNHETISTREQSYRLWDMDNFCCYKIKEGILTAAWLAGYEERDLRQNGDRCFQSSTLTPPKL